MNALKGASAGKARRSGGRLSPLPTHCFSRSFSLRLSFHPGGRGRLGPAAPPGAHQPPPSTAHLFCEASIYKAGRKQRALPPKNRKSLRSDKCPRSTSSSPLGAPPAPPRPAPPAPLGPAAPWILSRTPERPVLWPICPWRDPRLRGPVGGGAERGCGSVSGSLSITPRVPRTLASKETPGSVAPVCPPHPGKPTWRLRWGP